MAQCIDLTNNEEPTPVSMEDGVMESLQAKDFEPTEIDSSMATVIRIKRKRLADPVETLLMTCKKAKRETNNKGNGKMADLIEVEEKVFHFAATLKSDSPIDKTVKSKVMEAILEREKLKALYKKNGRKKRFLQQRSLPELNRFERIKNKLKSMKLSHQHSEEKPPLRPKPTKRRASSPVPSATPDQSHRHAHWKKSPKPSVQKMPLVDEKKIAKTRSTSDSDDIYCNSVKMLREKLHVSEPREDDYVYDLYYCEKAPDDWNVRDILYVKPYNDVEFYCEPPKQYDDALYDDEDDSNDENNYRNDYPDEDEDSISESERRLIYDEEEDYESDDCDLGTRGDDAYEGFMMSSAGCEITTNFDDYDCVDNFCDDLAADQLEDYGNAVRDDYNCANDDFF